MSLRDPGLSDDNLSDAIDFVLQRFKTGLHTAIPAMVTAVDSVGVGVRVDALPVVGLLLGDGTRRARPVAVNVPVVFVGGGGWLIRVPISVGDVVLLVFCERDISGWKSGLFGGLPTDRMLSESDAVAIPMLSTVPDPDTELAITNADGSTRIRLTGDAIDIDAATVRINGTSVG